MHNFIVKRQPPTFNSWKNAGVEKKLQYKNILENSFRRYNEDHEILTGELYGTIFHFYNKNLKIDADNLSKPLWDSLKGFLYNDDFQIKIRLAGSFDLTQNDFNILDLSGVEGKVIEELLEAFENEEHIVYIECGELKYSMFKFNLRNNGN